VTTMRTARRISSIAADEQSTFSAAYHNMLNGTQARRSPRIDSGARQRASARIDLRHIQRQAVMLAFIDISKCSRGFFAVIPFCADEEA